MKEDTYSKLEYKEQRKLLTETVQKAFFDSVKLDAIALRQAYSLGTEFVDAFDTYTGFLNSFKNSLSPEIDWDNLEEENSYDTNLYFELLESSGKLQRMLREELISVRES
jgi:hypothetical protein